MTLIEIVVVIAITAVISLPLIGTFIGSYKTFYQEDEQVMMIENARKAMDEIVEEVRKAEKSDISVSEEDGADKLEIGGKTYMLEGKDLILQEKAGEKKKKKTIIGHVSKFDVSKSPGDVKSTIEIELEIEGERTDTPYSIKGQYTLRY